LIPLNPRILEPISSTTAPEDEEERRCWICFVTDAEEDPPSEDWKSPCKCSLVAHESCLLDWVADLQKSGKGTREKLACPQCNTRIVLKQDRSLVLEIVDDIEKFAGRAGAFIAFAGVGSIIFTGCAVYGVNTIYTLCGPEYATELLLDDQGEFIWNWRSGVGLPLIPFVLIISRTHTLDYMLPVLPVIFFCHSPLHLQFPPSPAITLTILPYVRAAYIWLWSRYVTPHEQQWMKDVSPSFALENEQNQNAGGPVPRQEAGNNGNNRQRNRRGAGHADADANANGEQNVEWDGEVLLENHQIIMQGSNITSMIIGSLLWPAVAKMVGNNILGKWPAGWGGERIRKWLPKPLMRNIVGGLMVIVMKDFISLYCKYKRAQQFRTRKVMNYSETRRLKKKNQTK